MKVKNMNMYLRPRVSIGPWMAALALLLTIAVAVMGWMVWRQEADVAALRQKIALVRAATAAKPAPILSKVDIEQRKRWAQLQSERDFAWAPLFNALEAAGNPDIELLEFHPDKPGSTVVLRGEAKDEAALLDFMERLSVNPALKQVFLSHRKSRKRDRLVTVAFELKARLIQSSK